MIQYFPLAIFLQPVNDFGVEEGDALNTHNDALVHAQAGEDITDPVVPSDNEAGYETLKGTWKVQEREWTEHWNGLSVDRQLTIFIRKI